MYRLNKKEKEEIERIFNENGFDVLDTEKLVFELENQGTTYIGEKDDIIDQFIEIHNISFSRVYLDEDYICEEDEDWEQISNKKYVNTFRLFDDRDIIKKLETNLECIKTKW